MVFSVNNLAEFDCFSYSMEYLLNSLSRDKLVYPLMSEATVEPIDTFKEMLGTYSSMMEAGMSNVKFEVDMGAVDALEVKSDKEEMSIKSLAEAEDIYPYMLVMGGSGIGFLQVNIILK